MLVNLKLFCEWAVYVQSWFYNFFGSSNFMVVDHKDERTQAK